MCVTKTHLFYWDFAFMFIQKFQSSLSEPFGARRHIYTQVKNLEAVALIYTMQKVIALVALERCSMK